MFFFGPTLTFNITEKTVPIRYTDVCKRHLACSVKSSVFIPNRKFKSRVPIHGPFEVQVLALFSKQGIVPGGGILRSSRDTNCQSFYFVSEFQRIQTETDRDNPR